MTTYKQYTKKNGQKKWLAQGYLGQDPKTGKQKRTTLRGFDTKLEAKDAFEDAVHAYKHGTEIQKSDMTFGQLYNIWWPMYSDDVEPSTAYKTQNLFQLHILPTFSDMKLTAIEVIDAQRWVVKTNKKLVAARRAYTYAKKLMNFAVRMDYITRNPFDYVEFPRRQKEADHAVKQNYYNLDEFRSFVAQADKLGRTDESLDGYWIKGRAFLITMIATGLRRSELLTIKWSDIDFENQTLTVKRALKRGSKGVYVGSTKTAAGARTVYLDDMAIEFLNAWKSKQRSWFAKRNQQALGPDMWVFTHRFYSDRLMSENTPRRWMMELTETQGIRRITLHGLRHTKATLLAEAGANPRDIAAILGHTNATFTMARYVHPTQTGIAKAEQLFDGFVKSK